VQLTSVDENNQTTTTLYNDAYFWRPASVTDPTSAVTSFCYGLLTSGNCAPNPNQTESTLNFNSGNSTSDTLTTLDGLGRLHVRQTRQGPGLPNFDSVETDYDALGRINRTTLPYVGTSGQTNSTAAATTTAYDALSRPLTVLDGGNGSTIYYYGQPGSQNNDVLVTRSPAPTWDSESTKRRQYEYDALGRVRGSIEAIEKELLKLEHPEVRIKLLQKSVGGITEADVTLADASDAIIIGFNVVPDDKARMMADARGVQIRRYDVIYKITDDLKAALEGMLKPEEREVELGRALVQQVFKISRVGTIAGCRVLSGVVERNSRARIIRDSTIIGDYALDTLRREKDDAKEVREGYECGIKLAGFNDIKEGDLFEIYKVEEVQRRFEG